MYVCMYVCGQTIEISVIEQNGRDTVISYLVKYHSI